MIGSKNHSEFSRKLFRKQEIITGRTAKSSSLHHLKADTAKLLQAQTVSDIEFPLQITCLYSATQTYTPYGPLLQP